MNRSARRAAFAVLLGVPLLAGCSMSAGDPVTVASKTVSVGSTPRIKAADVEKEAVAKFGDKVPEGAKLACPDLKGVKGETARCTWTLADRSTLGMAVTVTSFTASTGRFRLAFENDAKVTPAP